MSNSNIESKSFFDDKFMRWVLPLVALQIACEATIAAIFPVNYVYGLAGELHACGPILGWLISFIMAWAVGSACDVLAFLLFLAMLVIWSCTWTE